jgi:hypothetical protein
MIFYYFLVVTNYIVLTLQIDDVVGDRHVSQYVIHTDYTCVCIQFLKLLPVYTGVMFLCFIAYRFEVLLVSVISIRH